MQARAARGVYADARDDLTWRETEEAGMRLAPVHASRESGQRLGYLLFERFAETGAPAPRPGL